MVKKARKNGFETLAELALLGDVFSDTFEVETGSGGRHKFYTVPIPQTSGAHVFGDCIDLKSGGGLVVGAGSVFNGRPYTILHDRPLLPADPWAMEKTRTYRSSKTVLPEEERTRIPPGHDTERANEEVLELARKTALPEGERNNHAYKYFSDALGKGATKEAAIDAYVNGISSRMLDPLPMDEVHKTAGSAYSNPRRAFADRSTAYLSAKADDAIDDYNKTHALVAVSGGVEVLYETIDRHGSRAIDRLDVSAAKIRDAALTIFDGKRNVPFFPFWLQHPRRRTLDGYGFKPGQPDVFIVEGNGQVKRYYNLWRPPSFDPAPSGVTHPAVMLFIEHTRMNICGGNEALFRWVMAWCAQLIQTPWIKPHTAIVLRGGKGVGKNVWVECLRMLLGPHSWVTSDVRYLVSHFTSPYENCLLIVFDEAFWSGNKAAEGALKNLITGTEHNIERKGREPYTADNLIRVIIIGNEAWLIPASDDERRFTVCDVGDKRKKDYPFFKALMEGMKDGGREVLLRYLMDYDITGVNLNEAPNTAALLDQKIETLDPLRAFWHSCIFAGHIAGTDFNGGWPSPPGEPATSIECHVIQDAFKRTLIARNIKSRAPSDESIGKIMASLGVTRRRQRVDGKRFYAYDVPSLSECRAKWDVLMGQPTQWEPE